MKQKSKILVVDDDPNLRKTLADILRVKGYEIAVAANGAEAIAAAEQASFSLTLIDLMLPDMGGFEVMARIKAISPLTEAIILTGHASMDTAIEATERGAYSYLLKPYHMDDLLQKIRHGVERQRLEWQLVEREALFSAIFNQTSIGIELIDPETLRFVEANPAACRMLGYTHDEFLQLRLADTQAILNEAELLDVVRQVDEAGGMTIENRHRCKNGDLLDVEVNSRMLDLPGKRLLVGVWSDVSKRKRQETMLHFRLKLIDMAAQVDHLHLMQATLDIAEELTGSRIGFFHYVEKDQDTISLQAWSSNTLQNMCTAEGAGQHYPVNLAGVWADAIRNKAAVIQNDYPHLASKKGMPQGHAVVDRFVSVPILRNNQIVALIGVGNKPSDYDEADVEIVAQLADLVFDLIETNKTQRALRESEEKFRKITESAQDAIIMMGAHERITAWNAAAEHLFGYSAAEAIGQELHPLITPPEAQLAFKHGFPHFLQTGTGPIIGKVSEVIALRKGGETFPVEVSLASLQIGEQWHAIGIFRDITERKRADENLRITASVFENSQEGIVITDANNVFLDVNPAFTQITGYTRAEVIGKNPRLLNSGRQDKAFYAAMWQSLQQKKVWRGEIWNRRKSGEIYAELLSVSSICDDAGRVQRYVGVFSDISYLKAHEFELSRIAHYDPLTNIPNRVLLADRMKQAIAQTAREQNMMAVCYLDLDGFKLINDTLGHEEGDQVLIEVAKRIANTIRGGDTVARLGGDEFVVLLLGLEKGEECVATIERLLAAIAQPIPVKDQSPTLSASIGVSIYPLDDEDPDTLMRHADQAMYTAKQSGKNRFHIYDPALDRRARDQHEFLTSIRHGLKHGQFELHYQPKINLRSRLLVGAEALIRWRHPERGLLLPAEFLLPIENTELDIEIGEWVIASALVQINRWHHAGLDLEVSINISAHHLESPGFEEKLRQQLAHYPDIPVGKLQIEILETAALNDIVIVREIIETCRKFGVGFALDDFGTGYSSLTYLSGLPVDVLKIDQSFVRDMLEDKGDMAIVHGIIALARAFDRQTVAEGIETEEHYRALLDMGCELGQGYGIARPMPAEELMNWQAG